MARLDRPALRSLLTLIQSSTQPDEARPDDAAHHEEPGAGEEHVAAQVGAEVADDRRADDGQAAHGGRAGLDRVTLGDVLVDRLTDLARDQHVHQHLGAEDGDGPGQARRDEEGYHLRDPRRARRASRATARSSNGERPVPHHLDGLVALAGDDHDITRAGLRQRQRDGGGPVRLDGDRRRGRHAGPDVLDDSRGSSPRGLSEVRHDAIGQPRGDLTHLRPLGAVSISPGTDDHAGPGRRRQPRAPRRAPRRGRPACGRSRPAPRTAGPRPPARSDPERSARRAGRPRSSPAGSRAAPRRWPRPGRC